MPVDFSSMLSPWQWAIILAVPPAIVALYFLKLRREPRLVSSTYLWQQTIEDLHVNSLWQRLRQNLLLFLQLLIVLLLILACLRPSWRGTTLSGERFIFLVDTSASMSATDVEPTRLEHAKRQIDDMVRTQLKPGDKAMLVSFSDRARVEQPYTTNHELLRRRLQAIEPTSRPTNISEALRVAAGLANPGRSASDVGDTPVAEALEATVFVFTDGGLQEVPDFSWGNLRPEYVPVGSENVSNLAVTALGIADHPTRPEEMQAIVRVENFGPPEGPDQEVTLSLYLNDGEAEQMLDATQVSVPVGQSAGAEFTLGLIEEGELRVEIDQQDALAVDNRAYAGINSSQKANVLLVTAENEPLSLAMTTSDSQRIAQIAMAEPEFLATEEYKQQASEGAYDLIIYDQCAPDAMPRANTLYLASVPPREDWTLQEEHSRIQIIDIDVAHPLMKYLDFGDVQLIGFGRPVEGPVGKKILLDSDVGPMCVIAPRDGFEDVVLGFAITRATEDGQILINTDWPRRLSFPLFVKNVLEYLAGGGQIESATNIQPGQAVPLRTANPVDEVFVAGPSREQVAVPRGRESLYVFNGTDQTGLYQVRETPRGPVTQRFAVNLFDPVESDLRPRQTLDTTWKKLDARTHWEPTRREAWRWLVALALLVAIAEWYIYNRRVYI